MPNDDSMNELLKYFTQEEVKKLQSLFTTWDGVLPGIGDLLVLGEVADRTGLSPFLKQVYLVARPAPRKPGQYTWAVQAGIDGYRMATRRYAASLGQPCSIEEPVFYGENGNQYPFWTKAFGRHPVAAKCTITIGESKSIGTAIWDECVQTTKKGEVTHMWATKPATMLGKCAEAQAHRRACPLTGGMYTPEEYPVEKPARRAVNNRRATGSLAAALQETPAAIEGETIDPITEITNKALAANSTEELYKLYEQVRNSDLTDDEKNNLTQVFKEAKDRLPDDPGEA